MDSKKSILDIKNQINAIFQILIALISIVAIITLLLFLFIDAVSEINRPRFWVEPFQTPKALNDLGYSGQTISYKILCELKKISEDTNFEISNFHMLDTWCGASMSIKGVPIVLPPKSQKIDIQIPKSGVSYDALKFFLLSKLNSSSTISGILAFNDEQKGALNISIFYNNKQVVQDDNLKTSDINSIAKRAGEEIIKYSSPLLFAFYLYEKDRTVEKRKCFEYLSILIKNFPKRSTIEGRLAIYHLYGSILIQNKKYEEAVDFYRSLIAKFPKTSELYNELGVAYFKLEEYPKAISCFNENLKNNNESIRTILNIASCYINLPDYKMAENTLTQAKAIDPQHEAIYYRHGQIYYKKDEFDKAIMQFNKALTKNSDYFYAYNGLGRTYDELKDYQKAIQNYKEAIRINPNFSTGYNNIGVAYYNLNDFDNAEIYYRKFIELTPNFAAAYINLGLLYIKKNEFQKANVMFEKAVLIAPKDPRLYYNWGILLEKCGKPNEAISKHEKAIELNVNYEKAIEKRETLLKKVKYQQTK